MHIFELLLYLVILAFFIFRLNQVLGRRDEDEENRWSPLDEKGKRTQGKVIYLNELGAAPETEQYLPPIKGLSELADADSSFNYEEFKKGAMAAFEYITKAFSDGDKDKLKPLLSNDVYKSFVKAIDTQAKSKRKQNIEIVRVKRMDVDEARLVGKKSAQIVVSYRSEQIIYATDESGAVVEGSNELIIETNDIWTFERDLNSTNPNWILIETASDDD